MGTLAVVELPLRSGLAKDKVVNTWAIAEANGHAGLEDDYATAIADIYRLNDAVVLGATLGSTMSPGLDRSANACSVKLYDITNHLDGSPHGSPYHVMSFTLPATAAVDPMPEECAICVTLEAQGRAAQFVEVPDGADPDAKPDRPRQRYTGRVYMGPWNISQIDKDASGLARPRPTLLEGLRTVIKRAADAIDVASDDTAAIGIWSRQNRSIRGAEMIRTDNAWDTQRRRGVGPTQVVRLAVADAVPEVELAA